MHQAAAKQFKSTTGNMLIAVHFVICFICSTVFLLNCFLIAYLLNRASQLYFPGHQLKGLTRVGSLILPSETGLGMIAELHYPAQPAITSDGLSGCQKSSRASPF